MTDKTSPKTVVIDGVEYTEVRVGQLMGELSAEGKAEILNRLAREIPDPRGIRGPVANDADNVLTGQAVSDMEGTQGPQLARLDDNAERGPVGALQTNSDPSIA